MELTGRLTKDAAVKTVKDNRQVVAFTVVMNDYYKPKGGEKKEIATFINCSYWISTKVATVLKKGNIVTLSGHLGINAYKKDEDYHAHITLHVDTIKIIAGAKKGIQTTEPVATPETVDDLPF